MNPISTLINRHRGYQQFDSSPSIGSVNPVTSSAVYDEAPPMAACRGGDSKRLGIELSKDPYAVHREFRSGKTGNHLTLLSLAAQLGHTEVCKTLLNMGANVNKTNDYAITPLSEASRSGHFDIVELLLNNGADVNKSSINNAAPLYVASQNGHSRVVELLLNNGADVNKPKKRLTTPLYAASLNGHTEVVKLLLKGGADANKAAKSGDTPLFVASQNGHKKVVELLLAAGADPQKKWRIMGPLTKSPLSAAKQEGDKTIVSMLKTAIRQRKTDCGVPPDGGWSHCHTPSYDSQPIGN